MNVKIVIGEFMMAEPSFRRRSRLVAVTNGSVVHFGLQQMHDGEPGTWLDDPSFPWHGRNFDSIIRAAAQYHEQIKEILRKEKA